MGKVVIDMSMSLDGFIAGPSDDVERLHHWVFGGKTNREANILDDMVETTGAVVMGRRTFDLHPSGPYGLPAFILTHNPQDPEGTGTGRAGVIFVTDGIESALKQAKVVAGDKNIGLMGANIQQQCLSAGLVDEIHIHLIPVLLGDGTSLFGKLSEIIELEKISIQDEPGATHLTYKVKK